MISHLSFFRWLDGTKTEDITIQQSHITAISFLIVECYKSSITLAVGAAFSQHMWHVFRTKTLAIRHIERLFNLRSSIFNLARVNTNKKALILFSIALFVWVLPFVTIFPPSALTVSALGYMQTENRNVPVLEPSLTEFDPWQPTRNNKSILSIIPFKNMSYPATPDFPLGREEILLSYE
jgi:hypothetical protein